MSRTGRPPDETGSIGREPSELPLTEHESSAGRASTAIAWSVAERWVSRFAQIVVFVFVARLLTRGEVGLMAVAGSIVVFARLFVEGGLGSALVQRKTVSDDDYLTVAICTGFAGALFAILTILMAPWIAAVLNAPDASSVLRVMAVVLVVGSLTVVPNAILARALRFRAIATRRFLSTVVAGAVAVLLALNGAGVWALVAQALVASVVGLVFAWRASGWVPRGQFAGKRARELCRFGAGQLGASASIIASRNADNVLLSRFQGLDALGVYSLAYDIYMLGAELLMQPVSVVVLPALSRLQEDRARFCAAVYRAIEASSLIGFGAFLFVSLYLSPLLPDIIGDRWASSAQVLSILCFAGIGMSALYFTTPTLVAWGRPGSAFAVAALECTTDIVLFAIAAQIGVEYVAAAVVLRVALSVPLHIIVLQRVVGVERRSYIRALMPAITAGGAVLASYAAFRFLFRPWGSASYSIPSLGAGIIAYVGSLWMFHRESVQRLVAIVVSVRKPVGRG